MKIKLTSDLSVLPAGIKLAASVATGIAGGSIVGLLTRPEFGPLAAWDIVALSFLVATWRRVLKFDAELVERHATREDPSRFVSDIILLLASGASLVAIGLLLVGPKTAGLSPAVYAGFSILSVIASWLLIHTVFTLRYAQLFYTKPIGGVDFGDTKSPRYADFAYLAFTVGMTYQVSDTILTKRKFRATALRQALLSFVFGTIIIAMTINLVAGLGK
jgi:uncharacterized membrane protein